jgi:endoglucanase
VQSRAAGSQGQWFGSLVAYLSANPWMGWTYWALNGEDSYDLLDGNYDATPVSAAKQSLLAGVQFPLPGAGNGTPPPTGSAAPVSCTAAYSLTNTWAGGFQGQVVLTNTGSGAISPWTLTWTFAGDQKISQLWSASFTQSGEAVTAVRESYNATIAPGGSVTIGFTGTYTSSNAAPASFAVNGTACST